MKFNVGRYIQCEYVDKDCWEMVRWVYKDDFGIDLPPVEDAVQLVERGDMFPVEQGEEQIGDVLVFRGTGRPHVAVVTDPKAGLMFHTVEGTNACEVRYRDSEWRHRLKSIYRHRDMRSQDPIPSR